MPDFSDAVDPYESPVDTLPAKRPIPGGLKAICIIAMILGGLGTIAALASGVGLVLGQAAQAALNPQQPGVSQEMQDIQQEMQSEINPAIANRYMVPNAVAVMMHLFTSVLLLVGSIMTLQRKNTGLGILTFGCAAAILYVMGYGILSVMIQLQTVPVYEKFGGVIMAEAGKQAGGEGAEAMASMPNLLMIGVFVGLAFSAVFALVKIVFYLVAILYMRKPQIKSLFRSESMIVESM